jgi:thiol-disulfide isomerase/thioredoxin
MPELGLSAPAFRLPDVVTGREVSLDDFGDAKALLVAFWCNHCPFVIHVEDAFLDFAREYLGRGLEIVAINANDRVAYPDDDPDAMRVRANEKDYPFPYLFDESQEVAKAYEAACTPDFFLYDGEGRLAYRGQFDASRPDSGVPVTGQDLRAAVDAVLAGGAPPAEQLPSLGCNIKWRPGNEPAYYG